MGKILFLSALLLTGADTVAPEILHLARIQSKAKLGLSGIPAYTCSEVMERSSKASSRSVFRKIDELKFEVAEIGGRELFSKAGEKSFNELNARQLSRQGLIATGMFYQMAKTVFGTPYPRFEFKGNKRTKGHKSLQYDLTVSPLFASYHLNFNNHDADCGFRGSIWADESSFDLIRLRIEATGIPPELQLFSAITEIDYARASLGGNSYLIPSSAEIDTIQYSGAENLNKIRFSNCHKYDVESIVTFQ